jgi:hypothetical protein
MAKPNVNPHEVRIAALYEKLTGEPMVHGQWRIEMRNLAQNFADVEASCRSILTAMEKLDKCTERDEIKSAVDELKKELRYIGVLKDQHN